MRAFLALLLTAAPAAAEFVVVNRCPPAFTVVNRCPPPAAEPAPLRSFVDAATGCTYTETAPGSRRYVRTSCPAPRR